MSAKEDAKHKFCFWYRLVRKFSTNSLLNDKTVEVKLPAHAYPASGGIGYAPVRKVEFVLLQQFFDQT